MSSSRSAKEKDALRRRRKEEGLPVRGDADAGRAKTPYPPRGGRNAGGRGRRREPKREAGPADDRGTTARGNGAESIDPPRDPGGDGPPK